MNERIEESGFLKTCGNLSLAMLALYFADIILLGTGALTRVGPVSTRILFFAMAIAFSVPLLLVRLKQVLTNGFVIGVVLLLVWVVFSGYRGWRAGNDMAVLKADVMGYLNYAIVPTMICVLDSEKRVHTMIQTVVCCCLAVSALVLGLTFYTFFSEGTKGVLYGFLEGNGFCGITELTPHAVRLFFHTASRYFFVGYLYALYLYYRDRDSSTRFVWLGCMGLFLYGVFVSYTRGVYAGSFVGVMLVFGLQFLLPLRDRKRLIGGMAASAGCVLAILLVLSLVQRENLLSLGVSRVLKLANTSEEAQEDMMKLLQSGVNLGPNAQAIAMAELMGLSYRKWERMLLADSIALNPILGNGLGKTIPPFDYVEYSYHDVVNKMGVIGIGLFLFPLVFMAIRILRARKNPRVPQEYLLLSLVGLVSSVYFLFIAYSNPCMNTTVGISCYCLGMALVWRHTKPLEA